MESNRASFFYRTKKCVVPTSRPAHSHTIRDLSGWEPGRRSSGLQRPSRWPAASQLRATRTKRCRPAVHATQVAEPSTHGQDNGRADQKACAFEHLEDAPVFQKPARSARLSTRKSSPQEFDGTRILGRFPEDHKFGLGRRYALRLKQQVAQVLVSPPAT